MPNYIPNILNGQESTFYPRQYLGTVVVLCWSSHRMSPDIGGWIQWWNGGKIKRIQKILRVLFWGTDQNSYNFLTLNQTKTKSHLELPLCLLATSERAGLQENQLQTLSHIFSIFIISWLSIIVRQRTGCIFSRIAKQQYKRADCRFSERIW